MKSESIPQSAERSIPRVERSKAEVEQEAETARQAAILNRGVDAGLFLLNLERWSALMWSLGYDERSLDVGR